MNFNFKIPRKTTEILCLITFLLSACSRETDKNLPVTTGGFQEIQARRGHEAPLSANDFWTKILSLIREKNGFVTKEMVERTFSIKFIRFKDFGDGFISYDFKKLYNSDIGVYLTEDSKKGQFYLTINWEVETFGSPKEGKCLNLNQAEYDIIQNGWSPAFNSRVAIEFDSFRKNDKTMALYIAPYNCFYSIKFGNLSN